MPKALKQVWYPHRGEWRDEPHDSEVSEAEASRRTATAPGVDFRGTHLDPKTIKMVPTRDTGPEIKSRGPFRDG